MLSISCLLLSCGGMEWSAPGHTEEPHQYIILAPQTASLSNPISVTVTSGDTVYSLSRLHKVSKKAIIVSNNLSAPYHLQVGQLLILPRGREHLVKKGDTLFSISSLYGINTHTLARANDLNAPFVIYIGQKLRIPDVNNTFVSNLTAPANIEAKESLSATMAPEINDEDFTSNDNVDKSAANRLTSDSASLIIPNASSNGFIWPVKGEVISNYGAKDKGLYNDGINISAPEGSPVIASENGIVAYSGNELRGFGNLLLIKHSNGYVTAYAHNKRLLVTRGDKVTKGQSIATVGKTGSVTSPQLHFELRKGRKAVNPLQVIIVPNA